MSRGTGSRAGRRPASRSRSGGPARSGSARRTGLASGRSDSGSGGSSFQVRPQNHWARVSTSGNPPAAWLNEIRRPGYFSATPPVMIAAAPSVASAPTPNVATAAPGSRLGRHRHAVHEDGRADPVNLGPEPVELGLVQRLPVDVGGDLDAGQAGLHDLGQLGRRHVRVLQRHRAEAVEPGGEGGDQARDVLVGDPAQLPADFGGGPVVQQRGERREHLRVEPAGRRRRQAPLRVEPDRLGGEPHLAVDEELAAVNLRFGSVDGQPAGRTRRAPGRSRAGRCARASR